VADHLGSLPGHRIVLETSRPAPHFWGHAEWPHRDDDWIVPALVLEIERPWLLEAWAEADPWFLAANYDAPVEEMVGRCFVDVATTDPDYLGAFTQIFRTLSEGEQPRARKRAEMLSGPTHLRGALQAWDQQDDSVLAPDEAWWADQVLAGVGRAEAKAKIRWAED
jgi:hypothetical protein